MHQFHQEPYNPFEARQPMFRMWADMFSKMMMAPLSSSPTSTPPDASREVRSAMLSAWTDYWQQFMRSREFLESMKQSMDAAVGARKQFNDWLGQLQHEFQGVSRQDIDQLMRAMRHVEQRSVDGLERVADQLERIAQRLENLEKPAAKRPKPKSGKQESHE